MNNDEAPFRQMLELYGSPVLQDFLHHVQAVAGFVLPPSFRALFDAYHQHCFDLPRPEFNADWEEGAPGLKWRKLHSEMVFGSAQAAVGAVLYHRENLLRLEREVLSFMERDELIGLVGQTAIGGGNTQKLDFEYHAFVFAYRRALDYLAGGIAALLKQEFRSFRRLPDLLQKRKELPWVSKLTEIHSKYAPLLVTFLGSEEDHRNVRDRITHYMHVPAGSLNVNAGGVFFAGGGEQLSHSKKLQKVVDEYVKALRSVVAESISAMTESMPRSA